MGLFDDDARRPDAPLADRMRPRDLDEFVGQQGLLGDGTALRRSIERDDLSSIILWGPPGSGKTTLARIIAHRTRASFVPFSAVLSGIKEVRAVMKEAATLRRVRGCRTVVFIDEIHRFNKAQQDAFLPYVEDGTIVLIGATTENPSFEVISALLSRSRVYRFERLTDDALVTWMKRALADPDRGLGRVDVSLDDDLLGGLARQSQGDARAALGALDAVVAAARPDPDGRKRIDAALVEDVLQARALYYDKSGEEHFNLISALHKSMRNSDPDASLYWLGRMLDAGEDALYIARRIVRFASEDIGLADPRALTLAVAAKDAVHFVGRPEGDLALAEAAAYCALAPKSNALYKAWGEALDAIREGSSEPVPMHLRNAPTDLMRNEGYGEGYRYAHDHVGAVTDMECLPPALAGRRFYRPTARGFEEQLRERLEAWRAARGKREES
ncbi:MAG: replication-associated recombination protein A [Acidobacteriota bacterium]|nr:replication-associated recombination protein A [Acidobacteriota bacterium]